ncbi:hypothetical protein HCU64_06540 [Methylobacterium sp. C25]|uniref:hypothetical protein n=1 Tax=Methylobacterium sp. C25 TaxID=2721622 RepID=UPI001F327105|nr:hypothetical protein [Methylobacterium sp. C25]MCE4223404.1 hypothetical protein [Methylobacterium sp. C25]
MSLVVITRATATALTTPANVRSDLGLAADSPSDDQLRRFIDQASETAATYCRRIFGRQTMREHFDLCRRGTWCAEPLLSGAPVNSVASVSLDGTVLDPSGYRLDEEPADPISLFYLRLLHSGTPILWRGRSAAVEYKTGWFLPSDSGSAPAGVPLLPAAVERAVILLVGVALSGSGRDIMIKSEQTEGVGQTDYYVQGTSAALPHPEAESILSAYRRVMFA